MSRFAAWCGGSPSRLRVIAAVQAPLAVQAILPVESVLEPGSDAPRTPDMGGKARTEDLGKAIADAI